ncbi:MAG: carbohydrate ABC transporter permease [Blautia sp.]|nr:carbohydrate ABC transporter permease [Blautia sp.]MDY3999161.1 carbohydrate ABC transporter permease [Blautia sp.]
MKKIMSVFLWLLAFLCVFPVFFMITGSLMGSTELKELLLPVMEGGSGYASWKCFPQYPTLKSYVELLIDTPGFYAMMWNTVKIAAGVLAGQMIVGIPAAWGFARFHFPFRKTLFMIYIALMMMPFQVMMLSSYLVLDRWGQIDTLEGIILPAVFSTFPVFLMYRFFVGIPEALIESARLDGGGEIMIFLKIGLPLGSPGIISATVLGFLEYWNLLEQPMAFLKSKELWPLSLFLPAVGMEQAGIAFAASVVALCPALLVFLAGQDYLEQGIISTAVKE